MPPKQRELSEEGLRDEIHSHPAVYTAVQPIVLGEWNAEREERLCIPI
jgi:hypothetical protein